MVFKAGRMIKNGHNLRSPSPSKHPIYYGDVYVSSLQLSYTLPSIILTKGLEHKCTEASLFSLTHRPQNLLRNVTRTAITDENIGAKSPNVTGPRMSATTDHLLKVKRNREIF